MRAKGTVGTSESAVAGAEEEEGHAAVSTGTGEGELLPRALRDRRCKECDTPDVDVVASVFLMSCLSGVVASGLCVCRVSGM